MGSSNLLTRFFRLTKQHVNAKSNASLRRSQMRKQNEAHIPKRMFHRLPLFPKTKHAQFQIQHSQQKMGKNHNKNQTNNWLQGVSIQHLI